MSSRESASFEQGIRHSRNLLLHGLERLANNGRAHFAGAQVADFLDLQQIEKGIGLGDGDEASFLPARQLARREAKNPYQIDSIVAVHRND